MPFKPKSKTKDTQNTQNKDGIVKMFKSSNSVQIINGDKKEDGYTALYDSEKPKNKGQVTTFNDGKKETLFFQNRDNLYKFLNNFSAPNDEIEDVFDIMRKYINEIDKIKPVVLPKYTRKMSLVKKDLPVDKKPYDTRKKPKGRKRSRRK